jgi:hypothetical protein
MDQVLDITHRGNLAHWPERVDLAAAFRWTARMGMHEAVANHFSLAVNDDIERIHSEATKCIAFAGVDASEATAMTDHLLSGMTIERE